MCFGSLSFRGSLEDHHCDEPVPESKTAKGGMPRDAARAVGVACSGGGEVEASMR